MEKHERMKAELFVCGNAPRWAAEVEVFRVADVVVEPDELHVVVEGEVILLCVVQVTDGPPHLRVVRRVLCVECAVWNSVSHRPRSFFYFCERGDK